MSHLQDWSGGEVTFGLARGGDTNLHNFFFMEPVIIFKDAVGDYRALNKAGRLVAWSISLFQLVERLEQKRMQHTIDPEMVEVLHKRFPNANPI